MNNNFSESNIINDYNFLMLCNNFIIDILRYIDEYKLVSETIEFKDKDKKKAETNKYDIFYWRDHGYANIINKSMYKHIFFSLVADYNIYMQDAIDCAVKQHYGTAYTLLRKPLKDNLLLMEMMYVKGHRFVSLFLKNSIDSLAIDKIKTEEKKKILRKCCKKLQFLSAKGLYNLRYSKKSKESLEKIWNKTMHIITSDKNYATENGNLNIIFSNDKVVEENIIYFYKVCTSMQLYFINILLNVLRDEMLITNEQYAINKQNIFFAFLSCSDKETYGDIAREFCFICRNCKSEIFINKGVITSNFRNNIFKYKCLKCGKEVIINGFEF